MKQWSKETYILDWYDACEKAKHYSENIDGTDKGSWRLPTPEELKDFTLIEDKDVAFWTSLEGLRTSTIYYLKHGSMSSIFKKNRLPTVFVRDSKIEEKTMKIEWEQNSPKEPMTWDEADKYAKSLGDGWRLPTKEELKEAYDNKLEGFQFNYYWSSSPHAESTSVMGSVEFHYGCVSNVIKTYNYYVRCVKDIRKESKIEWFKKDLGEMNWYEAMEYAKSLGEGWRLPYISELKQYYIDDDMELPKDVSLFSGDRDYWTQESGKSQAFSYSFYGNCERLWDKQHIHLVRLCRDIKKETLKESFWEIRDLVKVQEKSALVDDYNLGLYNGMELCLALLEKREPKYKDLNPTTKQTIPRYRIDVLQNSKREITGMKYELEESGNWIQYNDVRNLIEKQEHILSELKKLLDT